MVTNDWLTERCLHLMPVHDTVIILQRAVSLLAKDFCSVLLKYPRLGPFEHHPPLKRQALPLLSTNRLHPPPPKATTV